ncbi:MAG TPA: stage II sporulation protein P [Firmicutes bacterium]|nr:stage II sporulation protein P [Bacillota bacterium]
MNKKGVVLGCVLLLVLLTLAGPVWGHTERTDGYYTLVDAEGRRIARTAHEVKKGDQYLTADNKLYRVEKVEENTAHLRFVREVNLEAAIAPSLVTRLASAVARLFPGKEEYVQGGNRPVAIYHTHSAESYVPTDGRASIRQNGGIFRVGEALAQALRERGVNVIHEKTPHDPHDAMAYDRSRRTATELLKKNPIALLDIHRDAVPADEYADEINNTAVTKAQLVVGRQNPNMKANEAFAYQIKSVVDKKYPGFIKGIFYADGKYNQDLAPRLLLVEMGSHTNSREEAERGAAIFAAAAKEVLANPGASNRAVGAGATRALLWIVGLLAVGVAIYFAINGGFDKIRTGLGSGGGGNDVDTDQQSPKEE